MNIEIDIVDDRYFTDVASVVDREDFILEIKRLRIVFDVEHPLLPSEASRPLTDQESAHIDSEVEKTRKKLYLPVTFRSVILAAVFSNKIENDDYSPAYLESTYHGTFDMEGATPDETFHIVLSPNARDEDVIRAFQKYRDQLGNVKGTSEYKYIHEVWDKSKKKPSIRKYRKWYWSYRSGDSAKKIVEAEAANCPFRFKDNHGNEEERPKSCTCYDESTIRKGIETYEYLIWKTPTS